MLLLEELELDDDDEEFPLVLEDALELEVAELELEVAEDADDVPEPPEPAFSRFASAFAALLSF